MSDVILYRPIPDYSETKAERCGPTTARSSGRETY